MNAYFASFMLLVFSAVGVHLPDAGPAAEAAPNASAGDAALLEAPMLEISNMVSKTHSHLLLIMLPGFITPTPNRAEYDPGSLVVATTQLTEGTYVEGTP